MYVVRRTFRNYGQMITPGSVVEPGNVKRFKSRLNDRYIIEVNEHNFEKWDEYFRVRMNVSIPAIKADDAKADDDANANDDAKADDAKADDAKAVKATAVVKAVSK